MYEGRNCVAKQGDFKENTVCLYIRLSMEDDDVSGSSSRQRAGASQRKGTCFMITLKAGRSLRAVRS